MLAHSPPFPLVIDYSRNDQIHRNITAEDEEGIVLALERHDRIRRIRLQTPDSKLLQKFIVDIDEEYPLLEYLVMQPFDWGDGTALKFPETFQAPRLRHLMVIGFAFPIGSQLLPNASSIVTLCLKVNHPDAYFKPNTLLQWISFMPQLETLVISFFVSIPNRDVERHSLVAPITQHVTLHNLRFLVLEGVSAYMEAVLRRITAPRLQKFDLWFFKQLTFSVPRLQQFMNTATNLRFDSAKFEFRRANVYAGVYLREEIDIAQVKMIPLLIVVHTRHLDWQVSSVAQIFNSLSQIFSTVENLTLEHDDHSLSSEEHNEVDRSEWRKFLRSFGKAKTLRVGDGLVKEVSRILRSEDKEDPLELLPELQSLIYSGIGDPGDAADAFTPFIDARQISGHPVTLVRPDARPATPEIWDW